MMRALGAEVVLVDQMPGAVPGQVSGDDLALVEAETARIVATRRAFRADQFTLAASWRAHYLHTGPEMIRQTQGGIDVFCDFAGSGGSFVGCAAALKEFDSRIRCYLIEPEGAAALSGAEVRSASHRIQGGGYARAHLPLLNTAHIDGYRTVSEEAAMTMCRRLAREEGIFAGFSSGANVAAAVALLQGAHQGSRIAVLLNDSGLKYLSTDLWE